MELILTPYYVCWDTNPPPAEMNSGSDYKCKPAEVRETICRVNTIEEAAASILHLSMDEIMTAEDIQEHYGFNARTVKRWANIGMDGPPYFSAIPVRLKKPEPGGGQLLFRKSDVEAFEVPRRDRKPKKK